MSEVATKNITFWNTTDYNYPGFGKTVEISDGLGGKIGITYNQIDYDDAAWKGKPDRDRGTPITESRFLSGEIKDKFSLIGKVKRITSTMPIIKGIGKENNYSVTLDFSKYKASAAGSQATDGATSADTYLAISRFSNGSKAGYTTIKVTAITLDGSELNLGDWKLFNSGTLGKGDNTRIFIDAATQTISGKNSQGKQELSPTPPNPGSALGTDTGLGLFELPSSQRYVSITFTFKQKKIQGGAANDLHDIFVASNISSTSKVDDATPQSQPIDINRALQLHLPLNQIVENAAQEKEVLDISPTKLKGKVNGATIVADSRFGSCINFDGVDDYIELSTTTVFQTDEITISFWANGGKSLPKYNSIITAYDDSGNRVINIHLPWLDSKIYFDCGNTVTSDDNYDRIEKLAAPVDFQNKWTHWVFTKNVATGEMNIYLDGTLWESGTSKNKPITSIYQVIIGSGYQFYDGKVAHLRIYNRVLSPEEISECITVDGTSLPMDINQSEGNETTDTTESTGESEGNETTDTTEGTGESEENETTDTTESTGEGEGNETTETTESTGEGEGTETTDTTESTGESEGTETTETTETTDTTQKPMEYQIYQVNGNPTIKTGYSASEWTAVIAGFNCGAEKKHKATALTIMPVVDNGEWKIKCNIKDADDLYWDVAVLFIRNNMVNRLDNFHR